MATKIQLEKVTKKLTTDLKTNSFSMLKIALTVLDPSAKAKTRAEAETEITKALGADPAAKIGGLKKPDQEKLLIALGIVKPVSPPVAVAPVTSGAAVASSTPAAKKLSRPRLVGIVAGIAILVIGLWALRFIDWNRTATRVGNSSFAWPAESAEQQSAAGSVVPVISDPSNPSQSDFEVTGAEVSASVSSTMASGSVTFNPSDYVPVGYQPAFVDRTKRTWLDWRLEVLENGERQQAALVVTNDLPELLISRTVPDDLLDKAWCQAPDSDKQIDILESLAMIDVPAGGPSDSALSQWLKANEVNIADGELLPQNSNVVLLKNSDGSPILAGTVCYFHLHDDPDKGVNVGLDILTGGQMPETRVETVSLK